MSARLVALALALLLAVPACANAEEGKADASPPGTRNGREIYERFRDGLADPECKAESSARWRAHFAHAPKQLAGSNDDVLPLFGYVVDALREANLPTEFALIPFVESGYKPGARSAQGPAGLWQMIAVTARNHKVPMRAGYDGRLSPVDSTTAAVRYLKTLYGMFAGDWRLAVMAYNAGEYRVLGALKRGGQTARNANPEALPGLSPITQAYVRKLHALSCLLEQADDREEWLHALDRPVPLLQAVALPANATDIAAWARRNGQDATQLQRLNPAFAGGHITRTGDRPARVLAVAAVQTPDDAAPDAMGGTAATSSSMATMSANPDSAMSASYPASTAGRRHTVSRGDSPWKIAARYDIRVADLLERNGLKPNEVLRPGRVLLIDAELAASETLPAAAPTP
ncbi:lytic transglycosylase domain-containing protein [Lysobacter tyrosinilyticus]